MGLVGGLGAAWALNEYAGVDDSPLFLGFSVSQGTIAGIVSGLRRKSNGDAEGGAGDAGISAGMPHAHFVRGPSPAGVMGSKGARGSGSG